MILVNESVSNNKKLNRFENTKRTVILC
jgi:hypothetical protein